jgi:RNA polymerase sigma-70 factor, ECF subfamily
MEKADEARRLRDAAEQLSEPLLRYLYRYAGDRAVAEDLRQETLLRIARGLPSFDGRASLQTWAFTIATRVAADHFRKPANRLSVVEFEEIAELPDLHPAIDEQLIVDEMNACIRKVIDSLPEDYRAALVLHDLQGLTAIEVGESAGVPRPPRKSASIARGCV